MSHQNKADKHLGKQEAHRHDRHHKHEAYNSHKLSIAMAHNKYERDHGGESAKPKK